MIDVRNSEAILGRCCIAVILILLPVFPVVPWMMLTGAGLNWGWVTPVHVNLTAMPATPAASTSFGEIAGGVTTLSTALLLCFVAIIAGLAGLILARSSTRGTPEGICVSGMWLLEVALLSYLVVFKDHFFPSESGGRLYKVFSPNLFDETLGVIAPDRVLMRLLDGILDTSNLMVIFAAVSLAAAAASIALEAIGLRGELVRTDLKRLERRLDAVLLASAATLVAGMLLVKGWTAWPAPFLDDTTGKSYGQMTAAFAGFQAVCYVGVLVAIYAPAALMLEYAIRRVDPAAAQRAENSALMSSLMRTLAVLSPVLAGPVATFLGTKLTG